ncbi:molybdate ABC transporter permease subunit [Nocardioides sp.]|uniref:molybdate ABC transporter permease subunit n=1 Tax=Nocardioides sp. TaxID=35761 RepID=UPI0027331467|nr:molybdate ABC transporter permease subunit [Nocardioides sp.]MDP3890551.1 molybdate ABC transporter permease subunit [Nocardioides sp.]
MARDPLGRPPAVLLVPAVLATGFLLVPLVSLVVRTPWSDLPAYLTDPAVAGALWISLVTAVLAMTVCTVLGLPLAWLLARIDFPGKGLLRALVTVPLVLPPVVAGVALLSAFGRTGTLGAPLRELFGLSLPYTTTAVVMAHVFVALPFFVIAVEGALRSSSSGYDAAAASLGATRWTTFRRITVPLALPGIAAGVVLGFARSLGEFGATITFAGNYPGVTQTMPTLIYQELQADQEAARVLSLVMLILSITVLAGLREHWLGPAVGRT